MSKKQLLTSIEEKMKNDKSLPLRDGATNLVFGEGSEEAEIMFIGEGPGYWEDQKARPFVGRAGALLNQMLASINISRESVYITNVVHFRPPQNRDPLPEEIGAFQPYLDQVIKIINPKLIITLGRFSMGKFLPNVKISQVHGKMIKSTFKGQQINVLPMYHPAAALRNGNIKLQSFQDFKKIPQILSGLESENNSQKKTTNGNIAKTHSQLSLM